MTTTRPRPADSPTRRRVALDGRSGSIDPRRDAVRADLADIRLADRVFAPHYAAPVTRAVIVSVPLRADRTGMHELAVLAPGDRFELLDVVGDDAWGIATGPALVGYVDAVALGEP